MNTSVVQQFAEAIDARDGERVVMLLDAVQRDASARTQLQQSLPPSHPSPWPTALRHWCEASAPRAEYHPDAFNALTAALEAVYDAFREEEAGNWAVPVVHRFGRELLHCAMRLDASEADRDALATDPERAHAHLRAAESVLKRGLALMMSDRTADERYSKRQGALGMIVFLLRIYFALNNLRLCTSLVRTVESPGFPAVDAGFALDQRVPYHYYVGRMALYEDRYAAAAEHLTRATRECPLRYARNRRRLLTYLVPVRLALGRMPSSRLLQRYGLVQYTGICQALRTGDIARFDWQLHRYAGHFRRTGTMLLIERLRPLVYRALFRRIAQLLRSTRIALEACRCGMLDAEMELDEVECVLANLIYQGYVRGYLSHEKRYLVLSAQNAFPRIAQVASAGRG
ncbi:hypothetical protein CDCA_CDCA10G3060 [Cyanidium caldarium]|uniref:PCI domain-containing protein n=1 Tax=Cyanidium caldarium TaxID=2771 RepID=A0AAV9IXH7_CYACA|nr:hypothetical protein CDCA_CDCA10G3060 [Cyanidium caldarium]